KKNDPKIWTAIADMKITAAALRALSPGREVELNFGQDTDKIKAVIVGIKPPQAGFQHLRSQYHVTLAIPGETRTTRVRLSTLLQEMGVISFTEGTKPHFAV